MMKRSEVVTIIAEWMVEPDNTGIAITQSHRDEASSLLAKLEDIGMQPPEILVKVADNGCEDEGYEEYLSNVWEPE
jgi:hypothetical protein